MMIRRSQRKGYAILSVLIVVVIIAILSQGYFGVDAPGGKMWVVSQKDRTRAAVAAINFRTAETEFFMHTEGRQLPIGELRKEMDSLQKFSRDGRFFLNHHNQLEMTAGMENHKFAERMQFPRIR